MTDTRDRITEQVERHPGVHFNELVRSLDLAPGQVQYHVRKLLGSQRLVDERIAGRTHYYPPTYDAWERRALAMLRRETAGDVVATLLSRGPARPAALADDLDIARSTLEHHLDGLVESDLVEKRRDDRNRVTLHLTRPVDTVSLLDDADPHLFDRLVSRFTRLVDRLLAE